MQRCLVPCGKMVSSRVRGVERGAQEGKLVRQGVGVQQME